MPSSLPRSSKKGGAVVHDCRSNPRRAAARGACELSWPPPLFKLRGESKGTPFDQSRRGWRPPSPPPTRGSVLDLADQPVEGRVGLVVARVPADHEVHRRGHED